MTKERPLLTKIDGDLTLRHAQDFAQTLRDALAATHLVVLDTKGVTAADISTVQLLLAARKQALTTGKTLTLATGPQGVLRALLIQTGFLDDGGRPLAPDGDFWIPSSPKAKGKSA